MSMADLNIKNRQLFIGPVIHSVKREQVTIIPNAAVIVENGKISAVKELLDSSQVNGLNFNFEPAEVTTLSQGQFLMPGMVDAHIHAPQLPNAGLGYDKPLLDWLSAYTFPLEERYGDTEFAKRVYKAVVDRTLSCGTTTAVYFGTVHCSSCQVLAEVVHCAGQRALVGKVNMDKCCVPGLLEDTATSITDTEAFVQHVKSLKSSLVQPVITPRFAITCTASLLRQLADLAQKYDLHVQTHLSENKEEIKEVLKMFPDAENYAGVYDQAKLLNRKTVLAHCVHLEDAEVQLVREKGSSVIHCPNSNICLKSGLCDVRRLLQTGVNVALGTDVAGGCNPSILDAIRCALNTSITLSFTQPDYQTLTYHEAFYLATVGGAIALDMENELGNFAVGKYFDAVIVDTRLPDSPVQVLSDLSLAELFQKFIYTGDDRNIRKTYVNGILVKEKP